MRIRQVVAVVFSSIICGSGPVSRGAEAPVLQKPNIIFIFSDDHSLQTIGAYGSRLSEFCKRQNVTPNIDRLAAEGGLFVNSFCGNSICSPSRAAVLTGLHAHANGVMVLNRPVSPGVWTFPGAVRAAGYQTAVIGKWHLDRTPTGTDFARLLVGQGRYWNPNFIGPDGRNENHAGYATDVITDMGIDWLRTRDRSRPFMLMVHHKSPHRPWMPPPQYYKWLQDVKIPEPATLFDDYASRAPARDQKLEIGRNMDMAGDLKVFPPGKWTGEFASMTGAQRTEWAGAFEPRNEAFRKANPQGAELTRWKYQEYMKDYLRCVKRVDDCAGKYLDHLKAEGIEGNTVVIYSSDQGFFNGEHGWFDKRWIYEESIHMPLIVRWPGVVKPGSRFTPMVQNIDYAATFVDIAGGKTPTGLHGRSLVPILRGETPAGWRKSVYYHYYETGFGTAKHYGVRTGRYTLANFHERNEWELLDNEKDPLQLHNVHADPAYARTVVELKAELTRLRALYGDSDDIVPTGNKPGAKPGLPLKR